MIELWLPLGTALIGAVAGLLAGALGPNLTSRNAHKQWLRDKQAEQAETYHAVLRRMFMIMGKDEIDDREFQLSVELNDATARLELYCSPELAGAAYDVTDTYWRWRRLLTEKASSDEQEAALSNFRDNARIMRFLIRKELGVERGSEDHFMVYK